MVVHRETNMKAGAGLFLYINVRFVMQRPPLQRSIDFAFKCPRRNACKYATVQHRVVVLCDLNPASRSVDCTAPRHGRALPVNGPDTELRPTYGLFPGPRACVRISPPTNVCVTPACVCANAKSTQCARPPRARTMFTLVFKRNCTETTHSSHTTVPNRKSAHT